MRNYSVQQIKFELLSYLKEFGSNGPEWHIQIVTGTDDAPLLEHDEDDNAPDIWIGKPAINERAASIIMDYMVRRFGVVEIASGDGKSVSGDVRNWVFMYKRAADDLAA